jgi:methionyl-tRNA formyltransferase
MKIGILGCKGTTLDLLHDLNTAGIEICQVMTLPESIAKKNRVAFFRGTDIGGFCNTNGIPLHTVKSYHLKRDEDLAFFENVTLDLLLVIGWERLAWIPTEAFLASTFRREC